MGLSFTPYRCEGGNRYRVPRSLWIRRFPSRRLYQCRKCKYRVLAVKKDMEAAKWYATTGAFTATHAKIQRPHQPG